MTAFENLKKASEAIIAICDKEQHTKDDKNQLLKIQQDILTAIEDLVECEGCNRIVTSDGIAAITLNGQSAKLCKDCGIKSLESGKIVKKRTTQRRTRSRKKPEKTDEPETSEDTKKVNAENPKKAGSSVSKKSASETKKPVPETEKPVSEPPKEENDNPKANLNELYGEIESETDIPKKDVKKIHKLIEEIAVPMDLENTIVYTVAEIEKARMRIELPAAEKAVSMLFNS